MPLFEKFTDAIRWLINWINSSLPGTLEQMDQKISATGQNANDAATSANQAAASATNAHQSALQSQSSATASAASASNAATSAGEAQQSVYNAAQEVTKAQTEVNNAKAEVVKAKAEVTKAAQSATQAAASASEAANIMAQHATTTTYGSTKLAVDSMVNPDNPRPTDTAVSPTVQQMWDTNKALAQTIAEGTPDATETVKGKSARASNADVDTGTDDAKYMSVAKGVRLIGRTKAASADYATSAGTAADSNKLSGQPASYYNNPPFATTAEAQAGTVNDKTLTPLRLAEAMGQFGLWGFSDNTEPAESVTYNQLKNSGFYFMKNLDTSTGAPFNNTYCYLVIIKHVSTYVMQMAITFDGKSLCTRVLDGGVWKSWTYHNDTSSITSGMLGNERSPKCSFDSEMAALLSGGVLTLDCNYGAQWVIASSNITSIVFNNRPPISKRSVFTLEIIGDGTSRTINWGTIRWAGGTPPVLNFGAGKTNYLTFEVLPDGGWALATVTAIGVSAI